MSKKGKTGSRVLTFSLLLMLVLSLTAQAKLTDKKTAQAISEYASAVAREGRGSGAKTGGIPTYKTYGDLAKYRKTLKKYLSDNRFSDWSYGTEHGFSTDKQVTCYYWSLMYVNNPYIEYEFWTDRNKDGKWYGYIDDSKSNHSRYVDDSKKLGVTAAASFKKDFQKELAAYRKKYGKLSAAKKIACAANYVSQTLKYKSGWFSNKGKQIYASGDLYAAWVTRCGICSDYSTLFRVLCESMGINCKAVMGMVRDKGEEWEAHQWNLVQYNKKMYYVDVTADDVGAHTGIGDDTYLSADMSEIWDYSDIYLIG